MKTKIKLILAVLMLAITASSCKEDDTINSADGFIKYFKIGEFIYYGDRGNQEMNVMWLSKSSSQDYRFQAANTKTYWQSYGTNVTHYRIEDKNTICLYSSYMGSKPEIREALTGIGEELVSRDRIAAFLSKYLKQY